MNWIVLGFHILTFIKFCSGQRIRCFSLNFKARDSYLTLLVQIENGCCSRKAVEQREGGACKVFSLALFQTILLSDKLTCFCSSATESMFPREPTSCHRIGILGATHGTDKQSEPETDPIKWLNFLEIDIHGWGLNELHLYRVHGAS